MRFNTNLLFNITISYCIVRFLRILNYFVVKTIGNPKPISIPGYSLITMHLIDRIKGMKQFYD